MKIRCKFWMVGILALVVVMLCCPAGQSEEKVCGLPVLLYHHFAENPTADTVVSPARFREQMVALKEAGYSTITVQQILDFIDHGVPLPEKAVLITFDDGYTSNLTVAAPILEELGMSATVFFIGIYEGEEISPNSGNQLYPARFSCEAAREWVEKGVIELQSHTYNMHQSASDGFSGREGILMLEGERDKDYCAALLDDARMFARRLTEQGFAEPVALAYPYGFFNAECETILRKAGIRMTFTVEEKVNSLKINDRNCLWNLGRFNVTERDSGDALLRRLKRG